MEETHMILLRKGAPWRSEVTDQLGFLTLDAAAELQMLFEAFGVQDTIYKQAEEVPEFQGWTPEERLLIRMLIEAVLGWYEDSELDIDWINDAIPKEKGDEDWFTFSEVCHFLGLDRDTIHEAIVDGTFNMSTCRSLLLQISARKGRTGALHDDLDDILDFDA